MEKGRKAIILILLGGAVLAYLATFVTDAYYLRLLVLAGINVVLASSINLVVGYAGQASLAHAAFYGIGAYASGLLTVKVGLSFWLALPLAFVISAVFGALLGLPTLRLKGHYLSIATLGFGIIVNMVLLNWVPVTGGPMGLLGIDPPSVFGFPLKDGNYYLAFVIVVDALILSGIASLMNSPYGRAFVALREDEISAEVSGVNTYFYKVLVFAVSSGLAGVAGSLFAHYLTFISPEGFDLSGSIEILILAIIGGLATIPGPVVGAVGLVFLSEYLRSTKELRMIIYGALLVLVIIFLPEGIYPGLRRLAGMIFRPVPAASAAGLAPDARSPYTRPSLWRGARSLARGLWDHLTAGRSRREGQ